MKKAVVFLRPFSLLLPLLLFLTAGCGGGQESSAATAAAPEPRAIFPAGQPGGEVVLYLEVARTPEEKAQGLMKRSSLAADRGMIFVFEQPTQGPFWMKSTYIPLSITFVAADGVILDIQDMEPLSLDLHRPAAAYTYAIEANEGFFDKNGVTVGDRVRLEGI